jgi:hypothetical protein
LTRFQPGRVAFGGPVLIGMALAAATPAAAQSQPDIFIGTLAREQGEVILTRCDLARTRYLLRDGDGSRAVAGFRAAPAPAYAEVIGEYREEGGRPALKVAGFAAQDTRRSCHFSDLVALAGTNMTSGRDVEDQTVPGIAKGATDPAALAGHYYLSGVMETGSELLLRSDGSFEWYLSYGAMDQTAQGNWRVEGDAIVLTTAPVRTGQPLFAYLRTEPWSAEAEEEYRRRKWAEAEARVRARCPFLPELEVSATSAPMIGTEGPAAVPASVLREQAAATLRTAVAARTQVEMLARDVSPEVDRVREAQAAWSAAREAALEAARNAGLPKPVLNDPVLPERCTLPEVSEDMPQPTGRLGVRVTDLASQQPLRKVQVMLGFADGSVERLTTAGNGFAFVTGEGARQAVSATLHIDGVPASEKAMIFLPARSGILRFSVDLQQVATPAFTTLRLRIAGAALIPEDFVGGRYERQP